MASPWAASFRRLWISSSSRNATRSSTIQFKSASSSIFCENRGSWRRAASSCSPLSARVKIACRNGLVFRKPFTALSRVNGPVLCSARAANSPYVIVWAIISANCDADNRSTRCSRNAAKSSPSFEALSFSRIRLIPYRRRSAFWLNRSAKSSGLMTTRG